MTSNDVLVDEAPWKRDGRSLVIGSGRSEFSGILKILPS